MSKTLEDPKNYEAQRGFMLLDQGLFEGSASGSADPNFICSPIKVLSKFSDPGGKNWGLIISVQADDDTVHEIRVGRSELFSQPKDVIRRLLSYGLELASDKKSADRLIDFLRMEKPSDHLILADHSGWLDDRYSNFIAGKSVTGPSRVCTINGDHGTGASVATRGNVDDWKTNVGMLCGDNPMMLLAVSLALSGPLLRPLGLHGGGLHFRGASSTGKTTLLSLSASVWGNRGLVSQWRATTNGLEALAPALNDMLLPLDEIAEISPRALNESIYMLANGKGKARMTKDGTVADTAKWCLAIISSGEISICEKLAEGRIDARAGHEVRLIDVEADSRTLGVFDDTHGILDASQFANLVQSNSQKFYGTIGVAFATTLMKTIQKGELGRIEALSQRLARSWVNALKGNPDGQVERVAQRFATIGVAGFLATKWELTGWDQHEALSAAKEAFNEWFERRYSDKLEGSAEFAEALQTFLHAKISTFVQIGGMGAAVDLAPGWFDAHRVYLPPATWAAVFPGTMGATAAKSLLQVGVLVSDDTTRLTRRSPRCIPGRPRVYTAILNRLQSSS